MSSNQYNWPTVAIDNEDQPMEPCGWYDVPEWIEYNDDGSYDD